MWISIVISLVISIILNYCYYKERVWILSTKKAPNLGYVSTVGVIDILVVLCFLFMMMLLARTVITIRTVITKYSVLGNSAKSATMHFAFIMLLLI